ncbi:cysteine ABC transporter permease/ATP-binding protein [Novosphingobium nitrogenifigens DSM 19370]|uniref:Cysteine ABC transporter permease/ATP-binding protein n=1 Tax=Novosphingobium nitrogenifigens DSM 19370 TaxID=983920 RepID=F1Z608_9SPHN|nr:ATP-binding cassette domain-containing protein [Novosphingobium nitrogenifigens]EGD59972.1 cysteine ABC transporter permease/ATP-binding protein [Novosphingobium nitrogenifigens DSM 19370]
MARVRGTIASVAVQKKLRHALVPRLLPSRVARGRMVGEDMHLAIDSVAATEGHVARFMPLRMAAGLSPLIIALCAAPASYVSAGIMMATLPPFIVGMILAGGAAARRAEAQHVALSRLSGLFVDRVRTLPTILAFSGEERIARHLGEAAREVARRTMAVLAIAFASSAILEFFAALSVALVAVYCGFSLLGLLPFPAPEHLTLARAFFVLALAPEFYIGLRRLAAAYHDKQQGEAAIAAMVAEQDKVPELAPQIAAPRVWSGRGVILTHDSGDQTPEGGNARIGPLDWDWDSPGLHVVTGPTGSGKTSLLTALIGQVAIVGGTITADGAPFAPGSTNDAVGWAGQSVALLPETLRANLAFGSADDATMRACLDALGLGPMLERRGGLDLVLDHKGSGLSGGERRRIGLARAILSGRPVLLLDEPTADLDEGSAAMVRAVLRDLAADRLVIAATHDDALVAAARSVTKVLP